MRMQRPIILTAKHRMYGDTFDMAQTHEHVYECVQPLQAGRLTFAPKGPEDRYVNNLSLKAHASTKMPTIVIFSWDTIIWLLIAAVSLGCMVMTGYYDQTAFNEVYLTQFQHHIDNFTYSLQYAGKIQPLRYMIAALTCFCCSIIVGWQSNNDIRLNWWMSVGVAGLIFVLQVWGIGLHAVAAFDDNLVVEKIMLSVGSVICLHFATTIITLLVVFYYQGYAITDETNSDEQKTTSMFWLTVAEDLNLIVGYALVVTALNALASVHDDTTVFFDVVCIVMIGFLQHIANVLMIFHRHMVITSTAGDEDLPKIVNVIARSRLLIFFFIGAVVVFFYLRISPTYQAFTSGIPYEFLRVLAVITMVAMGTFHSIWYEFRHADNTTGPKDWETSPTWKLVTGSFIALVFCVFICHTARLDSNATMKQDLIDAKVS